MTIQPTISCGGDGIIERMVHGLRLPTQTPHDVPTIVSALLRRLCGIMCPCPPYTIKQAARQSLAPLKDHVESIDSEIEQAIENLLVGGDVLELSHIAMAGVDEHPTWLFCGPPSFVSRDNGIYLFGIAPDDAEFLPRSISTRIDHRGSTRFLLPEKDEKLDDVLISIGLRQIKKENWLASRKLEKARDVLSKVEHRLLRSGVQGAIRGLTVLSRGSSQTVRYRDRWCSPQHEAGLYIGRAEAIHGAAKWYVCNLVDGVVTQSLLLPFVENTFRACDAAWHLQLAIDADVGHAAGYQCRSEDGGIRLSVTFPLPLDARRRFAYIGGRRGAGASSNAFSFWLPSSEQKTEETYLRDYFWFRPLSV